MTTQELLQILRNHTNIKTIINEIPDISFIAYIDALLEEKKISKSEMIQKTNLDRVYAYQILNEKRHGSRNKILQFAFALNLNMEDTNRLLILSNNASLYPKNKRDAMIIFALSHHYSLYDLNELLDEYDFELVE